MGDFSIFNNQHNQSKFFNKWNLVIVIVFFVSLQVHAATYTETSIVGLNSRINGLNTVAGDIVLLANGTYINANVVVGASGITVGAFTSGGVTFNGSSTCSITGSNNVFTGFQYKNGNIGTGNLVEIYGNYNVITQCNFFSIVSHNYLHIRPGSQYTQITYCNLEAKPANPDGSPLVTPCTGCGNAGPSIQISTSSSVINYTRIRYCTFMNGIGNSGDFGNEPIRIGLGAEQLNVSAAVVEYCYFENVGPSDAETVSIKSVGNVVRYNTQNNNPLGSFSLRTGNNTAVYGNFFINSGGVRIKEGSGHMIYNNYFQGASTNSSLELRNDNASTSPTTETWRPNTIYIYNNTFYNPGNIYLNAGNGLFKPINVAFANNIFYKTSGNIFADSNTNVSFNNNEYFGGASLGVSSATAAQFTNIDPQLILNANNYYGLSSNSPAINNSNGTYTAIVNNPNVDIDPYLMLDIEGQTRPTDKTQKDMGADEYTTGTITNKPLARSDAGPSYLVVLLPVKLISFEANLQNQKQVNLAWKTASESNNDYFTVSKSDDGKTFISLINTPSKGDGGAYTIIDFEPFAGISYYKLSQTDKDGKIEELAIKTIMVANFNQVDLSIYPKPANNGLINITNQTLSGLQEVVIYDLGGKKLLSDKVNFINGNASYKINDTLGKGIYIIYIGENKLKSTIIIN